MTEGLMAGRENWKGDQKAKGRSQVEEGKRGALIPWNSSFLTLKVH
jgi:hypothetical protein